MGRRQFDDLLRESLTFAARFRLAREVEPAAGSSLQLFDGQQTGAITA